MEYGWLIILASYFLVPLMVHGNIGLDFSSIKTKKDVTIFYYRLGLIILAVILAVIGVLCQARGLQLGIVFKLILSLCTILYLFSIFNESHTKKN